MSRISPVFLLLLSLWAAPSLAGTLCGLITDQVSGAPVPRAGIFIYQNDEYTGEHAATDSDGRFCLDLDPGIYSLEVRVDNHITSWRDGLEVLDDVTSVDLPLAMPAIAMRGPWPNPASAATKIMLTANRPAPIELEVFDLRGRLLRRWATNLVEPGDLEFSWDGRDHQGRRATAGLYFIQARSADVTITRPLMLVK
jgi:hypothetical protein